MRDAHTNTTHVYFIAMEDRLSPSPAFSTDEKHSDSFEDGETDVFGDLAALPVEVCERRPTCLRCRYVLSPICYSTFKRLSKADSLYGDVISIHRFYVFSSASYPLYIVVPRKCVSVPSCLCILWRCRRACT